MSFPVIILAGGLGTHLLAVTHDRYPKPMVPIPFAGSSYPFLEFLLGHLHTLELTEIVICIGHLGQQICDHFGDGHRFGLNIAYDDAGSVLTATRALRASRMLHSQEMVIVCGDVYHPLDLHLFMRHFRQRPEWLMQLAVRPNNDSLPVNVSLADNGCVLRYARNGIEGARLGFETGMLAARHQAFEGLPTQSNLSLTDDLYPDLIRRQALGAFESKAKYLDVGSPEKYREFCRFIQDGGALPISQMP